MAALLFSSACSVKKYAVRKIGDTLAEGHSVYENDEDIKLVGEALPFGLKLLETLLSEAPEHRGLLLTTCRGFTVYSYAYVDYEAEKMAQKDLDRAREMRERARKLYLRALGYGLRGMDLNYPGFPELLEQDPESAVELVANRKPKFKDLPLLYWNAAALGLAISVSRNDVSMLARIPEVEAMLNRALDLNEAWDDGALHEFAMILASTKPGQPDEQKIRRHFERAVELSGGKRAGVYVTYAEAVAVPNQDREQFESLLQKALAIDPDADPEHRLVNLLAQRRARWLLSRADELILDLDFAEPSEGET